MTRKEFTAKYGRILLPLVTPFGKDEEIDYKVYGDLIEYLIKNDLCDSLIVTGTTGEASLLTFDDRVRLTETAVRVSAGRKQSLPAQAAPPQRKRPRSPKRLRSSASIFA